MYGDALNGKGQTQNVCHRRRHCWRGRRGLRHGETFRTRRGERRSSGNADLIWLSGASKANSAILHTGFDAPSGSVELGCMQAGYAEVPRHPRAALPAPGNGGGWSSPWSEAERTALDGIEAQARANGVNDIRRLTASEICAREPELSPRALEALLVPGEHVIDPWSPFLADPLQAKAHGAEIAFATEVLIRALSDRGTWTLQTDHRRAACADGHQLRRALRRPLGRTPSAQRRFRSGRAKVNSSSSIRQLRSFSERSSCQCRLNARRVSS